MLLLGVSYRSNVGDTRYTPVEYLHDYLQKAGCKIEVSDPYVEFWEEKEIKVSQDFLSLLIKNGILSYLVQGTMNTKITQN